jgi:hypothetical protein
MTWERVETSASRSNGVTVTWRVPNGRKNRALAISLTKKVAAEIALGAADNSKVIVERNRLAGKLRIRMAPEDALAHECRHAAWRSGGCSIAVPFDDVNLRENKPAQDVPWSIEDGWLVIKLPHWACPMIQVSGKVA